MDEILKAYGEKKYSDRIVELLDFDPELGFSPYVWISRRLIAKTVENNANNPAIRAAYEKYRKFIDRIHTEEMLKGQAFGL